MPTYEYKCDACGNRFEKFQSITAGPIRKCPRCGKNRVRRLISTGAGLIFKGSGFYITDYRDKSYSDKAKAESGGGASSDDKSSAPAESAKPKSKESARGTEKTKSDGGKSSEASPAKKKGTTDKH